MSESTLNNLEDLNKYWQENCTCELKNTATRAVFGNGNNKAEIVFIGEAPGKKEDETGIPFVGAAGKFLDEMLESIKMTRPNIYITNIVKYRPRNNRDPEPKEKEACKEWLHQELNLISPKLIVFLGRHSMNHFFPDLKISNAHGKLVIKNIPGINTKYFLPLYHPAAALYNGGLREELMNDFKKIPIALKKIEEKIKIS
ncbi:uracil-DNA glycosylase [Candidatus Nomurabacteria bacterium]|nr:uracil-DNA glycosylase [Candidatus Nomurabacteria bacterium]